MCILKKYLNRIWIKKKEAGRLQNPSIAIFSARVAVNKKIIKAAKAHSL